MLEEMTEIVEAQRRVVMGVHANLAATLEERLASADAEWAAAEERHRRSLCDPKGNEAWWNTLKGAHRLNEAEYVKRRQAILEDKQALPSIASQDFARLDELPSLWQVVVDYVAERLQTLSIKRRHLEYVDDYGNTKSKAWIAEIKNFLRSNSTVMDALGRMNEISQSCEAPFDWESFAISVVNYHVTPASTYQTSEHRNGTEFEHECLELLSNLGWNVTITPSNGDQGVDLLAEKNGRRVAVQCKNHGKPVGNGAVQEVFSGKSYYEAEYAAVVSRSGFTVAATQLAQKLAVMLVDSANLTLIDKLIGEA